VEEMAALRPWNASMGLMLETTSPRLRGKGMAHQYAPDKEPAVRIRMHEEAGELKIPFTSGILLGIGETGPERVDTLFAIRRLHDRYGHIQEAIIQPFHPKPGTPMRAASSLTDDEVAGCGLEGTIAGDKLRLSGAAHFVQDGLTATHLLVSCRLAGAPGGLGLALVHAEQPGIERRAIGLNEKTRGWAEIRFRDVAVRAAALVGGTDRGADAFAYGLDLARTGLAAELAGAGRKVLEASVEYAKNREQFGQPIGQFQAIAHKCANMMVAVESMSSAATYAAWSVGSDEPDARTSACLAKSFCSDAYTRVAGDGIQVHGGLGFTWEQDLHLYFKHAKAAEFLYGSNHALREIAAKDLIDDA